MARSNSMVVVMIMVAAFPLQSVVAQTTHNVGGPLGWAVPLNDPDYYTRWASNQTFRAGDILVFNFTCGSNVVEVFYEEYGPCNSNEPFSVETKSPVSLTLMTSGKYYFICTVGTNCRKGQKLAISVNFRKPISPPPVAPMPSCPNTPIPAPPSSATTFPAVVPIISKRLF